jgi:hypothetical protein
MGDEHRSTPSVELDMRYPIAAGGQRRDGGVDFEGPHVLARI